MERMATNRNEKSTSRNERSTSRRSSRKSNSQSYNSITRDSQRRMKIKQQQLQQQPVKESSQKLYKSSNGLLDSKTEAVFRRKNYRLSSKLGTGSYGIVYKTERMNSSRTCLLGYAAVKVLDLTQMSKNYRSKFLPRELQALVETKHENVVEVFDIIRSNNRVYVFMEYMGGGDVSGYLKKHNGVKRRLGCIWFYQVTSGLQHLHEKLFMCHRDIKLANMLLTENLIAKLSDFGFARISFDPCNGQVVLSSTFCGTLPYFSPQVLQKQPYDPFKADTWALGVSLFMLLENRLPFYPKDREKMLEEQKNHPTALRQKFSELTPSRARALLEAMLNPNEKRRPSVNEILSCRWLIGQVAPSNSNNSRIE